MKLDDVEKLLESATPGPWRECIVSWMPGEFVVDADGLPIAACSVDGVFTGSRESEDRALIVALRNLAPELLAVARVACEHISEPDEWWDKLNSATDALERKLAAQGA